MYAIRSYYVGREAQVRLALLRLVAAGAALVARLSAGRTLGAAVGRLHQRGAEHLLVECDDFGEVGGEDREVEGGSGHGLSLV